MTYMGATMEECHDHVRACADNPNPGAAYGDYDYWLNQHVPKKRQRRIDDASRMIFGRLIQGMRRGVANVL